MKIGTRYWIEAYMDIGNELGWHSIHFMNSINKARIAKKGFEKNQFKGLKYRIVKETTEVIK